MRTALKSPRSAVVSDTLAKQLFGSTQVLGKTLLLNNRETVHIAGVVSEQRQPTHLAIVPMFQFTLLVSMDTLEAMLPAANSSAARPASRFFGGGALTYVVFSDGASAPTADWIQKDLGRFSARHIPPEQGRAILGLRPVSELLEVLGEATIQHDKTGLSYTLMIWLFGSLVLITACLNYANLASAQATTRLKELALRRVVGASRGQVAAQSFFEALVLTATAAAVALVVLPVILKGIRLSNRVDLGSVLFVSPKFWIWLLVTLVVVALLASSYPAWVSARIRPANALQSGRVPLTKRRTMQILVVTQFALASFLFIATTVINSQNDRMRSATSGVTDDPIVVISNNFAEAGVDMRVLQDELSRQTAVKSVGATDMAVGQLGTNTHGLMFMNEEPHSRHWMVVTPAVDYDFFSAMSIKLLAGREFDRGNAADVETSFGVGNVVIDRALAAEYGWKSPQDAVGKPIYVSSSAAKDAVGLPRTVVGVVENGLLVPIVINGSTSTLYSLNPNRTSTLIARIAKDNVAGGISALEAVWAQLAPNIPLKRRFLDEQFDAAYQQMTGMTSVLRILAWFALFVGTMGLTGIAAHAMNQRKFEIGVRRTLGASVRQVLTMLIKDFSKPILIGNLIAWPFAFVMAKLYTSFFADKVPITIVPFATTLLMGLVIAWLAVLRQATSAARMNPAMVLRHE
jgi:putative ABC transport system permease protein